MKDGPRLILCGDHQYAPWSIVCIHLTSGKSTEVDAHSWQGWAPRRLAVPGVRCSERGRQAAGKEPQGLLHSLRPRNARSAEVRAGSNERI